MITREEAHNYMWLKNDKDSSIQWSNNSTIRGHINNLIGELFDQQDQLQKHIKSLEAQLANTEQLTCDGCEYADDKYGCQCPLICTRDADGEVKDFYTPKDTQ